MPFFFEAQEYLGIIVLCPDFFCLGASFWAESLPPPDFNGLTPCRKAATTRHTALYEEELVDTRQVDVWRQVAITDGLPDCLLRQQSSQADGWAVVPFRIPLIFTFTEDHFGFQLPSQASPFRWIWISGYHVNCQGTWHRTELTTTRCKSVQGVLVCLANEGCDWKFLGPENWSLEYTIYAYMYIYSYSHIYIYIHTHIIIYIYCIIVYIDICITILNLDDHQNFVAFVCTLILVPGRSGPTSSTLTTANESSSIRAGRTTDDTPKRWGQSFRRFKLYLHAVDESKVPILPKYGKLL